jgi:23S rRNA (cytidine2498-2'-O)-methyltransferase
MTRAILTCSPYFAALALNEMRRFHPTLTNSQSLAPGYTLLKAPYSFDKLTAPWRHRLPIYLHHCFPIHQVLALDGTRQEFDCLRQAIERLAPKDSAVQVRSAGEINLPYPIYELQRFLNDTPCLRPPAGRVVSVLLVQEAAGLRAYMGVSWATQNLSQWSGGQIPITESVPNRAGYKLLEALDAFAIHLRRGSHVLDLGAAPGAWTTLLRRRQARVTAVAPRAMYPWLAYDREVCYEPALAEEYLGRCLTTYDMIVNDMKLDAQDSARLMVEYARHLRTEGIAIMTLKLRMLEPEKVMDHSFRILRKAYKIIRVRQLVSNRREVTLFLRRHE